jgi:hypothetical protein
VPGPGPVPFIDWKKGPEIFDSDFLLCVFLINGILWDYWICLDDDFIVMSFVGNRWIGFTHGNVHLPRKPHWRKGKTMEIDYGNCFFLL